MICLLVLYDTHHHTVIDVVADNVKRAVSYGQPVNNQLGEFAFSRSNSDSG
ncbi:hypothetical protein [Leptolyngbya sp. Heron Island J]|uniref:hypothetical protein n=1 Tax=Leptolyngbya sp. Heron Island J TaxID=1385935 RepID=UPI0004013BAC|nr:hypothetical protein [Leptolyngbya sp. Heron Island J]